MIDFAVDLHRDDHAAARELLASVTAWQRPKDRDYFMAALPADAHPLLTGCRRAFFLKIQPGGNIHRHRDAAAAVFDTDLIVVETNSRSAVFWEFDGAERSVHLELGHRYRVEGRDSPHWAVNDGDADRVHLLIEYPKVSK